MDDAGRQILRPVPLEAVRNRRRPRRQGPSRPRRRVRASPSQSLRQPSIASAFGRDSGKSVPARCISASALPTSRQWADRRAAHPHAFEEGDKRGRAAGERRRTACRRGAATGSGQEMPFSGEMVHQAEKERQVVRLDALLVEGQDEGAARGMQQEIGVLRALGDALVGEQLPDRIFLQEGSQARLRKRRYRPPC